MLRLACLRHGKPYESIDQVELVHHATGEPVATVSQANSGLVVRDIARMDDAMLERFNRGIISGMMLLGRGGLS